MPYNINKYSGTLVATIQDGTIDNTFSIKLVGKNVAGYGEVQNENFLWLLENFAGANEPAGKTAGQIWYDSYNKKLKFYDGVKFRTTGGAEVGTVEPTGLTQGDFWFNTATNQLMAWSLTGKGPSQPGFVLVGPQAVENAQTTQMRSISVNDDTDQPHAIVEAVVNGVVIYIISSTEFTLGSGNPIAGFSTIKKGITLISTPNVTAGSDVKGVTTTDYRLWGTASDSERLGGVVAANYVRNDQSPSFNVKARFKDPGFSVGTTETLLVSIISGAPVIENIIGDTVTFKTLGNTPMILKGANIIPGTNNTSNIGSDTFKYATVYATSFNGVATKTDSVNVGGNYYSASTTVPPSTISIAARDSNGDLTANVFRGTATTARYADLAEKYLADDEYEVGTVVVIGGSKEVTACGRNAVQRAIGVVSKNPAYMMNSELEDGTYIALKGRVPVKVIGPVHKGDSLIAYGSNEVRGVAIANDHSTSGYLVFAVALEDNYDEAVKTVEALVL